MQWYRERRQAPPKASPTASPKADGTLGGPGGLAFRCGPCGAVASAAIGFHTCAPCFRDAGERHVLCSRCSRGEGEGEGAPSIGEAVTGALPGLQKSASAGALSQAPPGQRRLNSSPSEWSMVSSASGLVLPPPLPATVPLRRPALVLVALPLATADVW